MGGIAYCRPPTGTVGIIIAGFILTGFFGDYNLSSATAYNKGRPGNVSVTDSSLAPRPAGHKADLESE